MKILSNPELVNVLRKCSDSARRRIWIAVPYIGNWASVECIIGNHWVKNEVIEIRLLTDIEERTAFSMDTLQVFRGKKSIKHLLGLHAKIYIFDERAVVTSANLTKAAFEEREEVGILLEGSEITDVVALFEFWWRNTSEVEESQWESVRRNNPYCYDESRSNKRLKKKYDLPSAPEKGEKHNKFQDFSVFIDAVQEYKLFVEEYEQFFQTLKRERLWPTEPIYLETDRFMNFLFHEKMSGQPSKKFDKSNLRFNQFDSNEKRFDFISSEILKFIKFAEKKPNYIQDEIDQVKTVQSLVFPSKVENLTTEEIRQILEQINAIRAYYKEDRIKKICQPDNLPHLLSGLQLLLDPNNIPGSMAEIVKSVKGIRWPTVSELVGNLYPEKYPKINANSLAGLRYLGYDVPREIT